MISDVITSIDYKSNIKYIDCRAESGGVWDLLKLGLFEIARKGLYTISSD